MFPDLLLLAAGAVAVLLHRFAKCEEKLLGLNVG